MTIEQKLSENLKPLYLKVTDESDMHHHFAKEQPSHLRIEIVSELFQSSSFVQRHRTINQIISQEILKIRACSLHAFTPEEWQRKKNTLTPSPVCAHKK